MSNRKSESSIDESRRQFLQLGGVGLGAIALSSVATRIARADDLPHLTSADPTAGALAYTEDSAKVDRAKYPNHTAAQTCANCSFYQGAAGSEFAPCTLFPGKAVHAKGWCSAYAAKK